MFVQKQQDRRSLGSGYESINKRRKLGPIEDNNFAQVQDDLKTQNHESSIRSLWEVLKKQHHDPTSVSDEVLYSRVQNVYDLLHQKDPISCIVPLVLRYGIHHLLKYTLTGATVHADAKILHKILGVFIGIMDTDTTNNNNNNSQYIQAVWDTGIVVELARFMWLDFESTVRQQAALCVAHLARHSAGNSAAIIANENICKALVYNIDTPADGFLLRDFANCAQILLQKAPLNYKRSFYHVVSKALHTCCERLDSGLEVDDSILKEVAMALVYLSQQTENNELDQIFKPHIARALVKLIKRYLSKSESGDATALLTNFVRALGNLASGNTQHTALVIESGFIDLTPSLLQRKSRNLPRYTFWLLSNVAADCFAHTKQVMKTVSIWPYVIYHAEHGYYQVRREALWLIVNMIRCGNYKYAHNMFKLGAFDCFNNFLGSLGEVEMSLQILEAIKILLQYSQEYSLEYDSIMESQGLLKNIERQLDHPNHEVSAMAEAIIHQFFSSEEDVDENLAPVASETSFEFGVPCKKLFSDDDASPEMQKKLLG